MRNPFDLLAPAALLEHPDLPLPAGLLPPEMCPAIVVGTGTVHPSDWVEVVLRRDGGPARSLRAMPEPRSAASQVRWFRALLPEPVPGRCDEYRVELLRSGQRLAAMPADGSWYTVRCAERSSVRERAPGFVPGGTWPAQPRFGYEFEFFAALTVRLRAEILGATPEGYRINFFVEEGRVVGPRIDAEVLPGGGDWMLIRPDGIGVADIRVTWRTTDGALILERASGILDLGPGGYAKIASGDFTGTPPLHAAPTWTTAHRDWQWLNRRQGFGLGRVVLEKMLVEADLYLSRVGERAARG